MGSESRYLIYNGKWSFILIGIYRLADLHVHYNFVSLQITELLGISSQLLSSTYSSGPSPSMANANIKPAVHKLIHNLILHIHENEPDIEKSILVFLPTYYSLEQQWGLLTPLSSSFKVHILHSSIDTEQALMAMKILKSHRKVPLNWFLWLHYYLYFMVWEDMDG